MKKLLAKVLSVFASVALICGATPAFANSYVNQDEMKLSFEPSDELRELAAIDD